MENNDFDKRMEFLKKSYDRMPSSFDSETVFRKIEEESNQRGQDELSAKGKGTFRRKMTVWAVGIASVFLFGIITAIVVLEQQDGTGELTETEVEQEYDAYIESLKKKYVIEREKRREMLKLEEDKFEKLVFVNQADSTISIMANNRVQNSSGDNVKDLLLQDYERALSSLKLPSEMLEELMKNPLVDDEEGSIAFLSSYRGKVKSLVAVYNKILEENREAVDSYTVDSSVDKAEVMMLSHNKFPKELQAIIDTMQEQSIELYTNSDFGEIEAHYYESGLHEKLKYNSKLYPTTWGYVEMLVDEPYMFGPTLRYSLDDIGVMMRSMEQTLMEVERDSTLYPIMEAYFINTFYHVMKGADHIPIFDDKGILKEDYQQLWRDFAFGGNATPLDYVVKPIVEEMEASGWRTSEKWEALSYDAIQDALVLYQEGQLEFYMYGERPDFQDETISLPDSSFENEVRSLYTEFKKSYDKSVFKGKSPMYVVGVFNYANDLDDPETMYHLFHKNVSLYQESGVEWTVEWYVENWRKGLSLFRNATQLEFNTEYISRYEQTFTGGVGIVVDGEIRRSVSLIYDENGIWEMGETQLELLPSYHEQPEMDINDATMDYARYIYRGFANTKNPMGGQEALTIVGLYFYAGEIGDYATQYELFFQGEGYPIVDKDTYVKEAPSYFLPYSEAMYTTMSFKGQEQDDNGNWRGIAKLTVDTEKFPDEKPVKDFQMVWTEEGWRVLFMPMKK